MKKFVLLLLCLMNFNVYAQEVESAPTNKMPFQFEVGTTAYVANIAFGSFDLDFSIPFFQKGINSLLFKMSLPVHIPSSVLQPTLPYVLFGANWELQYALTTQKGFYFATEFGIGVASEFFQVPVYTTENGLDEYFVSDPYGMFSFGLRTGYDFKNKYNVPIKWATFVGYRMQFPFNFTVKHFILYGMSLSYTFNFGGK